MRAAIKMAWKHGGAELQSRFDKSTAQAVEMKEGALRVSVMVMAIRGRFDKTLSFHPLYSNRLGHFPDEIVSSKEGKPMARPILLSVLAAAIFWSTAILFAEEQALALAVSFSPHLWFGVLCRSGYVEWGSSPRELCRFLHTLYLFGHSVRDQLPSVIFQQGVKSFSC
jgi:hypothetical protein